MISEERLKELEGIVLPFERELLAEIRRLREGLESLKDMFGETTMSHGLNARIDALLRGTE